MSPTPVNKGLEEDLFALAKRRLLHLEVVGQICITTCRLKLKIFNKQCST